MSYALAGVIAVLTYRDPAPLAVRLALAVLVVYGIRCSPTAAPSPMSGHFTAVLIGLACYPLTRDRRKTWKTKHPAAQ